MKRSESHQIDERAQQIFRAAIPTVWVCNDQINDYGKDYLIETGEEDGSLTGLSFYVQLKGTKRVRSSKDKKHCTFRLAQKHALYYADKVKDLPVFLVHVDVTNGQAWYLFLQRELLKDGAWRKKKDVRLLIPLENRLSDRDGFHKDVIEAKAAITRLHPLSIRDSIDAHRTLIQKRDPRFVVDISVSGNRVTYNATPKGPLALGFRLKGSNREEVSKKAIDLFALGREVNIQPGELTIIGTSLLNDLEREGGVLQLAAHLPGEAQVKVSWRSKEGTEIAHLDVPGRLKRTVGGLFFEGKLRDSLVSVVIGPLRQGKALTRIPFDISKWSGHGLLTLPYFNQLATAVDAVANTTSRVFRCEYQGNELCTVTVHDDKNENAEWPPRLMALLRKARTVAETIGINPSLSFDMLREEADQVEMLYGLLIDGQYVVPVPNVRQTLELIADPPDYQLAGSNVDGTGSVGVLESGSIIFLGQAADIKPFAVVYDNIAFRSQRHVDSAENYDVIVEGTEQSTITFCRPEENSDE